MKVFLDSCIVIDLVEGSEGFSDLIGNAIRTARSNVYAVNDLVRLECLVGPLRTGDQGLAEAYCGQFDALQLVDMSSEVFDRAADIRARTGLKTPDALHLATALHHLSEANRLSRWPRSKSLKGTGFVQPTKAHEHWHVDMAYLNIGGTFYYFCAFLDGFSSAITHWEIRESMTEQDVECIVQRALERFPGVKPRIISDNGPQFIAKDFKVFVRVAGITQVRTSPYYPQSNGKLERWNGTVKTEALRVTPPNDLGDARRIVGKFVDHYNAHRLHSAIGYIAPNDKLAGRESAI